MAITWEGCDTIGLSRSGGYIYPCHSEDIPLDAIDTYFPYSPERVNELLDEGRGIGVLWNVARPSQAEHISDLKGDDLNEPNLPMQSL